VFEVLLASEAKSLAFAAGLARALEPGDLVGLEGSLGAGKTTFARGVVHGLGVPIETAVTSPTFALLHHYQGRLPIAHADFYRLTDEAELEELGLDELLDEGSLLLVEWGRKFSWVEEHAALWVELDIVSDVARRVRLVANGVRGRALIAAASA